MAASLFFPSLRAADGSFALAGVAVRSRRAASVPCSDQKRHDLVNYCAEHCTTFGDLRADSEAWAAILFGDATIDFDGTVRAE